MGTLNKSGRRRGRPVKSDRALRYLFASGILKGFNSRNSKGKSRRTVKFDRRRDKEVKHFKGKGSGAMTYRKKDSAKRGGNGVRSTKKFMQAKRRRIKGITVAKFNRSGVGAKGGATKGRSSEIKRNPFKFKKRKEIRA